MNVSTELLQSRIDYVKAFYLSELQAGGDFLRCWESAFHKLCGFRLLVNADPSLVGLVTLAIEALNVINDGFNASLLTKQIALEVDQALSEAGVVLGPCADSVCLAPVLADWGLAVIDSASSVMGPDQCA